MQDVHTTRTSDECPEENGYENGGLKVVNLERKKKAPRVKMMVRYLKDNRDHLWKAFLGEAIKKMRRMWREESGHGTQKRHDGGDD